MSASLNGKCNAAEHNNHNSLKRAADFGNFIDLSCIGPYCRTANKVPIYIPKRRLHVTGKIQP